MVASSRSGLCRILGLAAFALLPGAQAKGELAPAPPAFELIPASRVDALPPELRTGFDEESRAEALAPVAPTGNRTLHLRWTVRNNPDVSGYRVTLVTEDGLSGNRAARWLVPSTDGLSSAAGFTVYSTEVSLQLAAESPVVTSLEAVDSRGETTLLGVRRLVASPETAPARVEAGRSTEISTSALAIQRAPSADPKALAPRRAATDLPLRLLELHLDLYESGVRRSGSEPIPPRGPPSTGLPA